MMMVRHDRRRVVLAEIAGHIRFAPICVARIDGAEIENGMGNHAAMRSRNLREGCWDIASNEPQQRDRGAGSPNLVSHFFFISALFENTISIGVVDAKRRLSVTYRVCLAILSKTARKIEKADGPREPASRFAGAGPVEQIRIDLDGFDQRHRRLADQ